MDPLSATVDFFDYFNAKYNDRANVKSEPKTFTKTELQTMNYGSLWRGCIVLPTSDTESSMDIYKAVKHTTSSSSS